MPTEAEEFGWRLLERKCEEAERRAVQERQQQEFNAALAYWLPIAQNHDRRGYAPPTVRKYEHPINWSGIGVALAVADRSGHDFGDEDVQR